MKVKILKSFSDKENKCIQLEGKEVEISEERAEFILANNPELIEVIEVIEVIEDSGADHLEFPKHIGGETYLLSNNEKIKGKDAALKAEEELKVKE